MKRFVTRIAIEFVAIVAVTIAATQLVKSGYLALGVSILSIYGMIGLYRLGIEKINAQYERGIREARMRRLEEGLSIREAQMRHLEAALVDAASEALWVSDVEIRGDKVAYVIDVPESGRIVVHLPNEDAATKTDDASEASKEG